MFSLTFASIPKWKYIAKAIIKNQLSDNDLAHSWLSNNEKSYWFSRSAWSLYSIVKFRMLISPKDQVNVWLPSYFCNESTAPIRSLGIRLLFYPILPSGKPDLTVCNKMLAESSPDIIVYVHYFGEPLFSEGLYDLACNSGSWLVEDAAHCLKPGQGIGNRGDFVLYSPHKLLPIPDGGLLVMRDDGPSKLSNSLLENHNFEELYFSIVNMPKSSYLFPYKWLIKRLIQKLGIRYGNQDIKFDNESKKVDLEHLPHPKMSKLAKKMLSNMVDLEAEAANRKNNQQEWGKSLAKKNIIGEDINISISSSGHVPYLARLVAIDTEVAINIFGLLQKSKIPVSTWPDLPPEVLEDPKKQRIAIEMRSTCLCLPVHCSVNPVKIKSSLTNILN